MVITRFKFRAAGFGLEKRRIRRTMIATRRTKNTIPATVGTSPIPFRATKFANISPVNRKYESGCWSGKRKQSAAGVKTYLKKNDPSDSAAIKNPIAGYTMAPDSRVLHVR